VSRRTAILDDNKKRRDGVLPVRKLDEGYVAFKIPESDFKILCGWFPEMKATDPVVRLAAWKNFEASEMAERYRVTRHSPQHANRIARHGPKGIIIK